MALRKCKHCGIEAASDADLNLFRSDKTQPFGRRNQCNKCASTESAKRMHNNSNRNARLKRDFGITLEEYNTMFTKQNGCCKICGRHQTEFNKRLAVDHDHVTGVVRGLLCQQCNQALGMFYDNIDTLISAINYLEAHLE